MRRIIETVEVLAPPETVFRVFTTPQLFVACRPGISSFRLSTGVAWEPHTEFEAWGEFNGERYRARGRITKLSEPCSFGFLIPQGLGPLQDYQEDYRMTFAGESYTLMVTAEYVLPKGAKVGMMDRFAFPRRLNAELKEVLDNIATLAADHTHLLAMEMEAKAAQAGGDGAPPA